MLLYNITLMLIFFTLGRETEKQQDLFISATIHPENYKLWVLSPMSALTQHKSYHVMVHVVCINMHTDIFFVILHCFLCTFIHAFNGLKPFFNLLG